MRLRSTSQEVATLALPTVSPIAGRLPLAGPGACSPAGPPEPAARPSAQTPGCPGGLTGSLAGVFRQLASLVPLWCVQAPRSRLCIDCPEVCREVLGTVHGSVPASQQARPRLIRSSRTEPAESSGQSRADHVHRGRGQRGSRDLRRGPGGRAGGGSRTSMACRGGPSRSRPGPNWPRHQDPRGPVATPSHRVRVDIAAECVWNTPGDADGACVVPTLHQERGP